MRGVYFSWKTDEYPRFSTGNQVGMIAQEVQKFVPELVKGNEGETLSLAYDKMVAILIEGVKELDIKFNDLNTKFNDLNTKFNDLNMKIQ